MKPSKEFKGNVGLERIYLRKRMNKHKDDLANAQAGKDVRRWRKDTDASTKFLKMVDGKQKLRDKEVLKRNDQLVGRLYGLLTEQRERKSSAYAPGWRRLASGGVVIDCYRQEDDADMRFKDLHTQRKVFDKRSSKIDAQNRRLFGHITNVTSDLTPENFRDSYQKSRNVAKILLNRIPATALHLNLVGEANPNADASPYELYARTQKLKAQKKKEDKDDQLLLDNAYTFTSGYYTGEGGDGNDDVMHEALAEMEFTFARPNPYKPDYHPIVKIDGVQMAEAVHQEVPKEKPTTMDYWNKASYEEVVGVSAQADLNTERHNNQHSYLLNTCHTCNDPLNMHIGQKKYVNKDSYYEQQNPLPNLVSPTLHDPNYAHNTELSKKQKNELARTQARSPYMVKEGQAQSPPASSKIRKKLESDINIVSSGAPDKHARGFMEGINLTTGFFKGSKPANGDMGPGWNDNTDPNAPKVRVRPVSANSGLHQKTPITNAPSTSFEPKSTSNAHVTGESFKEPVESSAKLAAAAQHSKSAPKLAINSLSDEVRVKHMNRFSNIPPTDPPKRNKFGLEVEEELASVRTEDLPVHTVLQSPVSDRYRAPPPEIPSPEHMSWKPEDRYKKGSAETAERAKPGAVASTIADAKPQHSEMFKVRPKSASALIQNKPAPMSPANPVATASSSVSKLKQQLVSAQEMQQKARTMGTKFESEIKNVEDYKARTGYATSPPRSSGAAKPAAVSSTPTTPAATSAGTGNQVASAAATPSPEKTRERTKTDMYGRRIVKEKVQVVVVDTVADVELPDVLNVKGNHIVLRQNIICRTKILSKFDINAHYRLKDDPSMHLAFNIRITDVGAILPHNHFGSTYFIQTNKAKSPEEAEAAAMKKSRTKRLGSHVDDIITSRGIVVEAFYNLPTPPLGEEGSPKPQVRLQTTIYFPIRQLRNLCILTGNDSLYGELTHSIRSIAVKPTATQSTAATVDHVMKANPAKIVNPQAPPTQGGNGVFAAIASSTAAHPVSIKNIYKGVLYSSLTDHLDAEHQELLCTMIMRNIELSYDTLTPDVHPKLALIMPM